MTFVLLMLFSACKQQTPTRHGLYYWRTTLERSPNHGMDSLDVQTLYLRLFDVVRDEGQPVGIKPSMTIRFSQDALDSLCRRCTTSSMQIVPVVYISPDAITSRDEDRVMEMVQLILDRMDQVMEKNGLGKCSELQLDFDWAKSNQAVYFKLLRVAAKQLHDQGRKLSTTIRLHQLALAAPPVDRGVLMLYNTGNVQDADETNSILSRKAVEPYLKYVEGYSLPLSLALPSYSWNVVFRGGEFAFLAPGLQLHDEALFQQKDSIHWVSRRYQSVPTMVSGTTQGNQRIFPGDIVRREESSQQLNEEMMQTLGKLREDIIEEVIYFNP